MSHSAPMLSFTEKFTCDHFLMDYPIDSSFEDILELVEAGDFDAPVADVFNNNREDFIASMMRTFESDLHHQMTASGYGILESDFIKHLAKMQQFDSQLSVAFTCEAVQRYATKVSQSDPWPDNVMISFDSWKAVADKFLEFFNK